MKKLLTLLCASMMAIITIRAEVLLNEHFDRPVGTLSASTWSGGSLPNDSNWHTYSPGSVQFQIVDQQLQKADYCTATSGKAVQYTVNHSRDYILFPQALSSSAGDKAYLAFLMKVSELQTTSNAMSASNANNSILAFAINASNNALGSLNGRVIIQTVDDSHYKLGVSRRGETPQFASQSLAAGTTYLIVAEYCFVEGEKNDIVNLYIDPTPSVQTIGVTSVNPSTASADADQLVGVALCSNGNTPTDMVIDEVRAATSWAELWEDSSIPTPTITAVNSIAFGDVTIGEAAEKSITIQGADLRGAVSVSSDQAELVPAVASIAQADAEAGYTLSLALTATKEGAGSANLTLSSSGASDHIITVSWNGVKPVPPVGSELLLNGSFEDYSCNAMFGCSFDDWSFPIGSASANASDVLDGEVSMQFDPTQNAVLDQGVTLTDNVYAAGTLFELKLNYKVLSMPADKSLELDCYWEPTGGGDAETMKQHDAAVLQRVLTSEVSSGWEELTLTTSKPESSSYFRVRVRVPKSASVLFDAFSLVRTETAEPYLLVSPSKLSAVETTIGNSVVFPTLHIEQGNLGGATTFALSYTDAEQFSLSASSLAADQSDCDLIITYAPAQAGAHIAYLNILNETHPLLNRSIKLEGTCTDPSAQPSITVTPSSLQDFEAVVGQKDEQTITVASANCLDYVYLSMTHETGAAFTVDASMLSRNSTSEVKITFNPMEKGTYRSILRVYSQSNEFEAVEITLNGTCTEATPETVDWATAFTWDESAPLALLNETFDNVAHNKTLTVAGWQNVAAADARPWWGFDEAETTPVRGDGTYAKATAYQWAKENTGDWEMWLVTPALDYKNAASKLFAFSVMGEYLPEEGIEAALEVYYIEPGTTPLFQNLTSSFSIPQTSDEELTWVTFHLDLAPYAATMADVFYMAFRYVGPNGADGAVTYYIDNVSWGRTDLQGIDDVQSNDVQCTKVLRDGTIYILRGEKIYTATGQVVR
ncbi:MAG: choice-of-anchor D domain-containing protein [Paludibacteraceae bacterium]|nr:choice-of-anchor D domain-containing protein [Paludibacteraceae bacterium]